MKAKGFDVYAAVGRLLADNKHKEALALVNKYMEETRSEDVDMLLLKGNLYSVMKRFKMAGQIRKRAFDLDPHKIDAIIDLADHTANIERRYGKAIHLYDRALRILESRRYYRDKEEEFTEVCSKKARLLTEMKKNRASLVCVAKGINRYPWSKDLCELLGELQERHVKANKR